MSEPLDTLQPAGPRYGVKAANYGTADNPARIQTPNHNDPKPTVARHITPAAFDPTDTRPAAERVLDQQWRDVVRLGLATNFGALNPTAPGEA